MLIPMFVLIWKKKFLQQEVLFWKHIKFWHQLKFFDSYKILNNFSWNFRQNIFLRIEIITWYKSTILIHLCEWFCLKLDPGPKRWYSCFCRPLDNTLSRGRYHHSHGCSTLVCCCDPTKLFLLQSLLRKSKEIIFCSKWKATGGLTSIYVARMQ